MRAEMLGAGGAVEISPGVFQGKGPPRPVEVLGRLVELLGVFSFNLLSLFSILLVSFFIMTV